ncbi:hypothetical protein NL478_27875, partial [Klebsiella pneumoniae]|nr:hypothetical protein [Klebsiella pneumoniae]
MITLLAASSLSPMAAMAATAATSAAPADAPAAEMAVAEAEAIVVTGKGEVRQAQTLSNRDLAQLAPGTSPLKAIENLPS